MLNETREQKEQRIFNFYKKDLEKLAINKEIRFLCIEYVCSFPKINPYKMAALIVSDGFKVVFDDSSISQKENERKQKAVEKLTA